jgi:hypothetical protein
MEPPRTWRWASWLLALAALLVLTGGFGLLVPRIHGLEACGDYFFGRLFLCAPIGVTLGFTGLIALRSRSCGGRLVALAPVVFCLSVVANVVGGQDPLGAWLNWVAPHIDYSAIQPHTETAGCRFIENHEWITYDQEAGVYRAGRGA